MKVLLRTQFKRRDVLWAAVTFFTSIVPGVILYFICAFVMPEDDGSSDPNGPIDGDFKEL